MESYVAREFDFDFIYFDLLFALIWMFLLWRQKQILAWVSAPKIKTRYS